MKYADLAWLSDPEIFRVNRMDAHSDHCFYESKKEAENHAYHRNFMDDDMALHQSLNGVWKYHFSPNPSLRPADFYKKESDISGFKDILVPGHIEMQGYDKMRYVNVQYPWEGTEKLAIGEVSKTDNPTSSYVTFFGIKETFKGKRIFISFQGVENACYIWLNGHFIGYSEDSFTPSEFELTEFLEEDNRLCVEVYKRSTGCWLEDQDFWRFSGIFRDVYLYAVPKLHVKDCFVTTELDENKKDALVVWEGTLTGTSGDSRQELPEEELKGQAVFRLEDKEHNVVARMEKDVAHLLRAELPVTDAKLWSAESPYLYHLFLDIYDVSGTLVESVPLSVGIREFTLSFDHIMKLNGQRIVFHGVNRHEFSGDTGRTVSREEMLWDIAFLKKNNINAVRTCHYPNASLWYDLCDTYGIYLIDEANLETHGTWDGSRDDEERRTKALPGDRAEWKSAVIDRAKSMLERDKNHPSVLIWSCGNESFGGSNIYAMSQFFHERDKTRLVHYEGIFHDRRYNETSDIESTMYVKTEEIRRYLEDDPKKPYLCCEYMHAMGNSLGGMKLYTDLEKEYPMYQGGFIWDYLDQAIVKKDDHGKVHFCYGGDFDERPHDGDFSGDGILFADRTYSPKVSEVKRLYQPLGIFPERNEVRIVNWMSFTNADLYQWQVSLYREGVLLTAEMLSVSIAPGEQKNIPYPKGAFETLQKEAGEYTVIVNAMLKEAVPWGQAFSEVAFGQYIYDIEEGAEKNFTPAVSVGALKCAEGLFSFGVHSEHFSVLFDRRFGLISIQLAGIEYLREAARPTYFRANTDNDRGAGLDFSWCSFLAASKYQKCLGMEIREREEDYVTVSFSYQMFYDREEVTKICYEIHRAGFVDITAVYPGVSGKDTLPAFGMAFVLPASVDRYRYYGFGPDENYADRNHGQKLGIYSSDVKQSMTPYLYPQACGNHTGARWLAAEDAMHRGIVFEALGSPFECSVLPHSQFEIDEAKHQEELPPVFRTHVNILAKQTGVGGEDSWGATPRRQFMINAGEEIVCRFRVRGIER